MRQVQRIEQLAIQIVEHSLSLKEGQRVLLNVVGHCDELIDLLIKHIYIVGALPFINVISVSSLKSIIMDSSDELFKIWAEQDLSRLNSMDAYVGIRVDENLHEFSDIPKEKYHSYLKHYMQPLQEAMAQRKKWVLLKFPTPAMAQLAGMSFPMFCDCFHQSCNIDYDGLHRRAQALGDLMARTDKVRIVAPQTELYFSIKGISSYICDGRYNLPDGEIFTAPVIDSVEGNIVFNVPTYYGGIIYDQVELQFHEGKVVKASSNRNEHMWGILKTDEGSCRIGEFGIGLNPIIRRPMNSLIFDEKMLGSIHLALGQAYSMADNGNQSSIHWDMVLCQAKQYGGGEIYFDHVLIQKDGQFQLAELMPLNVQRGS